MKKIIKNTVGRCLASAACSFPRSRPLLRSLGLRLSHGLFDNRVVSLPINQERQLRLSHLDESYLAFQLFWWGVDYYEPITRALLKQLVVPGGTFLDIGAHLGFFSLTTTLCVNGIKVIAFEPNPKNFRILRANAACNGLNMVCEPLAISDGDGSAKLYLTESDMSASLMKDFQAEDTQQIGSTEVSTTSLDNHLACHSCPNPMVVKVDIEGHEPAFFRGAMETITARKPDIILEILYDQGPELVSRLKGLGYHFYPITDQGLVELEAPKLVKRFPFLFLNHLLSVRPRQELEQIFGRVVEATRGIDLLKTSKHFPQSEWPLLWKDQCSDKMRNLQPTDRD